jgi:oligopeptide/dipeptide ABC transporter ATP-binding protein
MAGSGTEHLRRSDNVLLRAERLTVEFPVGSTGLKVHAVSDVSLDVLEGETLGIVGESGCGKSTTGKALMQLPPPTGGDVWFDDVDLTTLSGEALRQTRPTMQMIFQDPISSLNPRRKISEIVGEPLRIWTADRLEPSGTTRAVAMLWYVRAALTLAGGILLFLAAIISALGVVDFEEGPLIGYAFIALLTAPIPYVIGQLLATRAPRARLVALIGAVLLILIGLVFHIGAVAVGVIWLLATGALLAMPASMADFAAVAEARSKHSQTVIEVLEAVGIDPEAALSRRPHEFSGGQCQRISIARSLVMNPKLIICDEPVSALDVSVQAQVLNLLEDLKEQYGLTLIFIAHDLAVVKSISDRVAVMYLGKLCEVGPPSQLYAEPAHPYTGALLSSIPVPDPTVKVREENTLAGEVPSPVAPPSGCRFRTRCPKAQDLCAQVEPKMRRVGMGHFVACHFPLVEADEFTGVTQS